MHLWKIEQVSHAIANGYWIGTINRVGKEPLGDNDFYGTSYFVNARGEITAEASDTDEEVLVTDLDLEKNREVRNVWQFYRDRRPDMYDPLVNG
jgi:N-carbamoylputrescine amidase